MLDDSILYSIFLVFTGAAVLAAIALFARQSLLVAYILLGVLLGPWGLRLVSDTTIIQETGHIGIIFLLFLLGLKWCLFPLGRLMAEQLTDPAFIQQADLVIMESTYGDRLHRSWEETLTEIENIVQITANSRGNILIPAFAVGRTQEILYMLARYYEMWKLERWQIFLDSPLAIEATQVFARHSDLFNQDMMNL